MDSHAPDAQGSAGAGALYGLLVEFDTAESLLVAARRVRDAGFTRWDAYTPCPVHGLSEAVGLRRSRLPWLVFVCGLIGAGGGLWLQWWTNAVDYPFLISGKPLFSLPANVPVVFELSILLAALGAGLGMLARNSLPRLHHALFAHPRFGRASTDRFFISIEAADPKFDEAATRALLTSLGGSAVQRVEKAGSSTVPRWVLVAGVILFILALIPPALIVRSRLVDSSEPRLHLVLDMDDQEKFKAQSAHVSFEDGRAMRPATRGTIARGEPLPDDHFRYGKVEGAWATTLPAAVTGALIDRGPVRFKIHCSPCHGLDGMGAGPVARRAEELEEPNWVAPKSLPDAEIREQPVGQLFNTITDGARTMVGFGDLIPPADRWAIVAHVRRLQRNQESGIDDVPDGGEPDVGLRAE